MGTTPMWDVVGQYRPDRSTMVVLVRDTAAVAAMTAVVVASARNYGVRAALETPTTSLVLALAGACGGGGDPAADCGLPTPDPGARAELLPEPFLLEGKAEVASAGTRKGGVTAVLSIRMDVQDALPLFKDAIAGAGFELVGEDNEGFEAELYLKQGKRLGSIQIRRTVCDDVAIVFVNVVKGDFAMPIVTTPSPSAP